jgi:nucleotide-binding universal stress UspA family protein
VNEAKTVLVGVANPRTAEHLVRLGIDIARLRGARLVVVSVVLVDPGESLSRGARAARTQRRLLRRAAAMAESEGWPLETLVRAGHGIDDALLEVAAEADAGLMIVGWAATARHGTGQDSALWRLSQEPPCDILSVKGFDEEHRPQRLILPLRGGRHADLAASLGIGLARAWHATVTILRVIPSYLSDAEAQAEDQTFRQYWEGQYPDVAQARTVVAPHLADCLVREAAGHDMLLMGAAATSRSYPFPFGQLVEEVANRVNCPVLIAKTEQSFVVNDFASPAPSFPPGDAEAEMSATVDKWFAENTFHSKEFASLSELVRLKQQQGLTISLILPTLNEEQTIGAIIECMREDLQKRQPLLDEILVIDSQSSDRTAAIARSCGVPVYVHQHVLPELGSYAGKGEALWKSLSLARGDIVVWIDTDIANIHPKFVYGLVGPLLREARLGYVKGFYRRPLKQGGLLQESSGGRVTELTARPLINLFYPLLSGLIQPLSGEYAGRRDLLRQLPFCTGYGVEIGLLIDIVEKFGLGVIGQVDLEQRIHRNQPLAALSRMSFTILQTVIQRLERQRQIELVSDLNRSMKSIVQTPEHFHLDVRRVEEFERPPMAEALAGLAGALS